MDALPIFLRTGGMPVILVGSGEAAAAKRRLLERAGAAIVDESGAARLAIVALDDAGEAEAAVARLRARGILVNATDRPALCDFTMPAILDRDPVLIAIGTGGASAGLAKALRQRLEALIPARLGELARALHAARDRLRERWPDGADRRRAIDAALQPGGALDPLGQTEGWDADVWLARGGAEAGDALHRFEVASDDPDDLTLRQARLLAGADTLYHSPLVGSAILDRARADAHRIEWWSADDPPVCGVSVVVMKAMPR